MTRKLLLVAVLLVALIFAASCGTTTSVDTPTTPSDESQEAAGDEAPGPAKAGMGDTLSIAGAETNLEVTLSGSKRVKAVKSYGMEMSPAAYGVKLTIKNVGDVLYEDSVLNCAVLIDAKDQSHDAYIGMVSKSGSPMSGLLDNVKIAPGDKRSGWLFYEMTPKEKPRKLQFTADSGFGPQVGEWLLK